MHKQARKGFRPLRKLFFFFNFLGSLEFLGKFGGILLKILVRFSGNSLEILWKIIWVYVWNSLGNLLEFFGNSLGIVKSHFLKSTDFLHFQSQLIVYILQVS